MGIEELSKMDCEENIKQNDKLQAKILKGIQKKYPFKMDPKTFWFESVVWKKDNTMNIEGFLLVNENKIQFIRLSD